jgi:hypothetical protein
MVFMGTGFEMKLLRIVPVGTQVMAALLTKVKNASPGAAQDGAMTNKQVN